MASYDKSKNTDYTLAVQSALKTLGADLGSAGVDGKWGEYTERAYQQNRAAVDEIVTGIGGSRLQPAQIEVPQSKSFDEWLSIGGALYAAQAEAQRTAAQRQLEYGQRQVEQQRAQSAATLETAVNSRGFGRSSYAADLLQRNEAQAQQSNTDLINNFSDALLRIEADRAANAAQYAGTMWKSQQDAVLSAQKFNAQMRQQTDLAQWKQDIAQQQSAYGASSSGGRSGKSGSKKAESASSVASSALKMGADAVRGVLGLGRSKRSDALTRA